MVGLKVCWDMDSPPWERIIGGVLYSRNGLIQDFTKGMGEGGLLHEGKVCTYENQPYEALTDGGVGV